MICKPLLWLCFWNACYFFFDYRNKNSWKIFSVVFFPFFNVRKFKIFVNDFYFLFKFFWSFFFLYCFKVILVADSFALTKSSSGSSALMSMVAGSGWFFSSIKSPKFGYMLITVSRSWCIKMELVSMISESSLVSLRTLKNRFAVAIVPYLIHSLWKHETGYIFQIFPNSLFFCIFNK